MVNDLNLLTDSDYQRVALAQKRGRTITVLREYKDFRLQVTTTPSEPPWDTEGLLIRAETWRGNIYTSQYFKSVDALKNAMKGVETC